MSNGTSPERTAPANQSAYSSYRPESGETEIDLKELFLSFLDHIRIILLMGILGAAISAIATFYFITPMYEATSKLYVLNSGDSAINLSDLQIGSYLASDFVEVFNTWEVHEMVIKNLGLHYSYSQIRSMLTVANPNDTRILTITVKSPSAKEAAAIANEYATVAIKFIADTMATEEPNVLSTALVPTSPSSPSITRNILLGLVAGLALAVAGVTIQFVSDDKIKSSEEVMRYTGLSVLAIIPKIEMMDSRPNQKGKAEE